MVAIIFIIIFLSYPSSPTKTIFPCQEPGSSSRGNDMKMKTENGGLDEMSKPYSCNDCDKRFRQKSHLSVHQRCLHSLDKPFMCPYCGKLFAVASNHKKVFMYICLSGHLMNSDVNCSMKCFPVYSSTFSCTKVGKSSREKKLVSKLHIQVPNLA